MRHLLYFVSVRHLKAELGRTWLTLFGVALGVAVVFAVELVNASVMASFRNAVDAIAGKTALTVGEGSGVAETVLPDVEAVPGVAAAVPVIEESARDVQTGVELAVLAVDTLSDSKVRDYDVTQGDVHVGDEIAFLNDPHGVLMTAAYARSTGRKIGDLVTLETTTGSAPFTVRGTLEPRGPARIFGGALLVMDVYAAQIAFGRERRFDRIDVLAEPGVETVELEERLGRALAGKAHVSRPKRRSEEAERILASFHLGLSLASLVAVFVGAFIVYNALAIAVAQRRREIGILRALGTRRSWILTLFLGEGLLLGAVGSAVGIALGVGLARAALGAVGETISVLYFSIKPEGLTLTPRELVTGSAIGVGAGFVASLVPAVSAARAEPVVAMQKRLDSGDSSGIGKRSLGLGVGTLGLAVLLAALAHVRKAPMMGYAVAGLIAVAAAFLASSVAAVVGGVARPLAMRLGPAATLGAIAFRRNGRRNAISIAALGMALASVVNASVFLDSMKATTVTWFERTVRADLFLFAGESAQAKLSHPLPASIGEGLSALPDVSKVERFRMVRQRFRGQPYYLVSHELTGDRQDTFPVVGGDPVAGMAAIVAGRSVAASESFAQEFDVHLGDALQLDTPTGPRSFTVSLVYADYNSDLGVLTLDRQTYERAWGDSLVDSYGVFLRGDRRAADRVREWVNRTYASQYRLMMIGNADYKRELVSLLDRSFLLTRATELLATLVALLGIVNTLLVSVIDRRLELGILKAVGAVRGQLGRMFATEAMLLGLSAALLGVVIGGLFSFYIVRELLPLQVGWRMTWEFSARAVVETVVLAECMALLASIWPIWSVLKLDAVEALRYE